MNKTRLLSLLMALVMLLSVGSMALADGETTETTEETTEVTEVTETEETEAETEEEKPVMSAPTVPKSSNDYDAPEFTQPVSMKTKNIGGNITVTFGDTVDSAKVLWKAILEEDEELTIEDGVATYSTAGHRYQPGVSGAPVNISWNFAINELTAIAGVDAAGKKIWGAQGVNVSGTNYWVSGAWNEKTGSIAANTPNSEDGVTIFNQNTGKFVTNQTEAYKVIGSMIDSQDQYAYIWNFDTKVTDAWITNPGSSADVTASKMRSAGGRVYDWGLTKTTNETSVSPVWKITQTYGKKIDGDAYEVKVGDTVATYTRSGAWSTQTFVVEGTDTFATGGEGTTYFTYTKSPAPTQEGLWLSTVREEFAEGPIESITAYYRNDAGRTLYNTKIEYRQ